MNSDRTQHVYHLETPVKQKKCSMLRKPFVSDFGGAVHEAHAAWLHAHGGLRRLVDGGGIRRGRNFAGPDGGGLLHDVDNGRVRG